MVDTVFKYAVPIGNGEHQVKEITFSFADKTINERQFKNYCQRNNFIPVEEENDG